MYVICWNLIVSTIKKEEEVSLISLEKITNSTYSCISNIPSLHLLFLLMPRAIKLLGGSLPIN